MTSNRPSRICRSVTVLLTAGVICGAMSIHAQSVTINPMADTFISEEYTNKNFGAMGYVNVGTTETFSAHRAMYKFDIAGMVPAGSTITSARLLIEVLRIPANGFSNTDVGLHRLLRDWGEGDNNAGVPRDAAPADVNESNWHFRFAGTPSTWGVPGGQAGVDYLAQSSAVKRLPDVDGYQFGSTPGMIEDVQHWLDNPAANFGWMAISEQENLQFTARRLGSSEAVPAFNVPRLVVEFLGIPEPSGAALLLSGALTLLAMRRNASRRVARGGCKD